LVIIDQIDRNRGTGYSAPKFTRNYDSPFQTYAKKQTSKDLFVKQQTIAA